MSYPLSELMHVQTFLKFTKFEAFKKKTNIVDTIREANVGINEDQLEAKLRIYYQKRSKPISFWLDTILERLIEARYIRNRTDPARRKRRRVRR